MITTEHKTMHPIERIFSIRVSSSFDDDVKNADLFAENRLLGL
jgi:hypothetical protein